MVGSSTAKWYSIESNHKLRSHYTHGTSSIVAILSKSTKMITTAIVAIYPDPLRWSQQLEKMPYIQVIKSAHDTVRNSYPKYTLNKVHSPRRPCAADCVQLGAAPDTGTWTARAVWEASCLHWTRLLFGTVFPHACTGHGRLLHPRTALWGNQVLFWHLWPVPWSLYWWASVGWVNVGEGVLWPALWLSVLLHFSSYLLWFFTGCKLEGLIFPT